MDAKQTVKYVAFHQVLATLAAVVGLGIVGVGAWLGFGDATQIVLSDAPQNWGDAVAAANPTTFVALAVVGVIVWQVGKTVALVVTIGKVADAAGGGGGADAESVKRAVLSDVDDRISSVESDVKRHEERISKAQSASKAESASASADGESRRSRRRSAGSSGSESSGTEDAGSGGDAAGDGRSRQSNRKSNRRASRSSDDRGSSDGRGSSTGTGDGAN
ncbi:hypothetical protein [Halorubellus salinus]|uniref:hypothetical protein n=1 Tax=Halorubellus salinus TaxID=755309 RepID=UPI001D05CCB2|nr:hypothetical protein [Halorubellus salinus]